VQNKLKFIIIPAVLLLFVGAFVDWEKLKAKIALYSAGYQEVTPAVIDDFIKDGEEEYTLLAVRAGYTDTFDDQQTADLLVLALREREFKIADTLLPRLKTLSSEEKADCMRLIVKEKTFAGIEWLVKKNFPKNIEIESGLSSIDWSIVEKNEALTNHLIKLEFPLTIGSDSITSLERTLTVQSSPDLVSSLISYGANPNAFSSTNIPLLHYAIANSSSEVVEAMITKETNLNVVDELGVPAFQRAVETSEIRKLIALEKGGCDLSYLNSNRENYLHLALQCGDFPEVVSHLLGKVDPNHRNTAGFNSLEEACRIVRPKSAMSLISGGATVSSDYFIRNYQAGKKTELEMMFTCQLSSPDLILSDGDTLLINSIKNKQYSMIEFLIEQGAGIEVAGSDLERPLAYAVAIQDLKSSEILLKNGAEAQFTLQDKPVKRFIDTVITDGQVRWFMRNDSRVTPIMIACDQGNLELSKLLRKYGAKDSSTRKHRIWAGNMAARQSKIDIVQLMLGVEPGNRDRTVIVDLSSQRATVYDKDKKTVMSFKVSSGKKGKETKRGTFVVTNKKRHHISTIYDTEMPYFQRLSYGDFGFHTGYVPGYPASSGCIRCPDSYARKLYSYLKVGDVVTIQR